MKIKYLYKILPIAFICVGLSACLKDDKVELDFDKGPAIVELPRGNRTASLDISSTPVVYPVDIHYSSGNPPANNITVTVAVDQTLLVAFNAGKSEAYELLPAEYYTLPTSVTIPAGESVVTLPISFKSNMISPSALYALPIKITDASGVTISGNYGSAVLSVAIKNKWHGTYDATGVFTHPVAGPRDIDEEKEVNTTGEFSVSTSPGDLGSAYQVILTINPSTNNVTIGGRLSPAQPFLPVPGKTNTYDPATKTFRLNYQYTGGGGFRVIQEDLKLK